MELRLLHHDARLTALLLCTTVLKLGIPESRNPLVGLRIQGSADFSMLQRKRLRTVLKKTVRLPW